MNYFLGGLELELIQFFSECVEVCPSPPPGKRRIRYYVVCIITVRSNFHRISFFSAKDNYLDCQQDHPLNRDVSINCDLAVTRHTTFRLDSNFILNNNSSLIDEQDLKQKLQGAQIPQAVT